MRTEQEIREKYDAVRKKSWDAAVDSHGDQSIKPVNRGAVYGWAEALSWVLGDDGEPQ